jgi:phage terminase small subunit
MTEHPGYRLSCPPEPDESLSAGAKQQWQILAPIVFEMQTCRPADLPLLGLLAELLADIADMETLVREQGYSVSGSGGLKCHPVLSTLAGSRRQAAHLLSQFGLAPSGKQAPKFSPGSHSYKYG